MDPFFSNALYIKERSVGMTIASTRMMMITDDTIFFVF